MGQLDWRKTGTSAPNTRLYSRATDLNSFIPVDGCKRLWHRGVLSVLGCLLLNLKANLEYIKRRDAESTDDRCHGSCEHLVAHVHMPVQIFRHDGILFQITGRGLRWRLLLEGL